MYTVEVVSASGRIKKTASDESCARMLFEEPYENGDSIVFYSASPCLFVQADQSLSETLLYIPEKRFVYTIPMGDKKTAYAPQAFDGSVHMITLRPARDFELSGRRNLALNPLDQRFYEGCYPHASANAETRDEPQFFARNVIDGIKFSYHHGQWPYQSWGIGGRADAAITLHFGRIVEIDEIGITLRADFPHDNWWTKGKITFSGGQQMPLHFQKTGDTQYFQMDNIRTEWITLSDLIPSSDPSPYPALTQWEVFGSEVL